MTKRAKTRRYCAALAVASLQGCGGRSVLEAPNHIEADLDAGHDAAAVPSAMAHGDWDATGSAMPAKGDAGGEATDAAAADSASTPSDGGFPCVNVSSDPHNCGACGHDCQGGACSQGACGPVVVFAGPLGENGNPSEPWGLAVDGANLYWSDSLAGKIMASPKSGAAPRVLATDTRPLELAVDATSIYWTDQVGLVLKAPLHGGPPVTLASSPPETSGIGVDSSAVYFTTPGTFNGLVSRVSLDGTGEQTLATGQDDPLELAIHGSTVFWSNAQPSFDAVAQQQGAVVGSVPLDGGTISTVASGQSGATQVAVDSTSLYWTIPGSALMRRPLNGGAASTLGAGCNSIAVDEEGVYCATGTLITRVPLDGGTPTTMADFASFAYGYTIPAREIVVDDTTVYWVIGFDALVMKVAK